MAKQYYNLEEAAQVLGVSTEEVNSMRERGELRAFADRGTWKFRVSEIDQKAQEGTSAVTFDEETDDDAQVLLSEEEVGSSDSSFPSTVIGMGDSPSDSDIQLVPSAAVGGSDSDVQLVGGEQGTSDSDVQIVSEEQQGSDSDVKIEEKTPATSDSDVRLSELFPDMQEQSGEASDFELADAEIDLGVEPSASADDLVLGDVNDSEINIAPSDSGISLDTPSDSGISLEQPPSAADTETISAGDDELLETDFEVPVLDESAGEDADLSLEESDFELTGVDESPEAGTEVIAVEGDENVDPMEATTVADSSGLLEEVGASAVEAVEEEMAVPISEELPAAPALLRAQESEWGKLAVGGLLVTTLLSFFAVIFMLDLARNLWSENAPFQISSSIMDLIVGK